MPLSVGDALLEVGTPTAPDASLSPSPGGATMDYNRPPRLLPPPRTTEFALPKEPEKPGRQPIPILVVIAPMFMGLGMYRDHAAAVLAIFVAMSPLMMLANWWQGRKSQGTRHTEQKQDYAERRARVENAAFDALLAERAARRQLAPDPGRAAAASDRSTVAAVGAQTARRGLAARSGSARPTCPARSS